jgi:hypothetical protein
VELAYFRGRQSWQQSMKKARWKVGPFVSLTGNAVIVIYRASPHRIVPVPGIVVAILRRSFELTFGNASAVATKIGVVF